MEIKACTLDTTNLPLAFWGKPSTAKKNQDLTLTGAPPFEQSLVH